MRWTFDADAGALYAYLGHGRSERQTEIADGVVVDLDVSGAVLGVEFLSQRPPFPREELKKLGVSLGSLAMLEYLVSTPLPRLAAGALMSPGGIRSDQLVEDLRIPA